MVALISSVIRVQSSSVFDDLSTAMTVGKGNEFAKKGDYDKARQYYDAAIGRDPTAYGPYVPRAIVFIHQRKWDLALQDLDTVIRLKPTFFQATIIRGEINQYLGNYPRAFADYDRILTVLPPSWSNARARVLNSRAWLRATCPDASFRNGKQAVGDAKGACNITRWSESTYVDTLAAAYAEAGDFDAAIRFEKQAMERALHDSAIRSAEVRQRVLAIFQKQLAGYEQRRPCRDTAR
jgi:tetratricopeptide (TPR) repeat protein